MPEQNGRVIVVKNWHVVLTLILWAASMVAGWATLRAETSQNTRDIEEMKRDHVTKDQYSEFQEDIKRRLQRIEDKLDRDRAMRSLR
jgi:hypothetical protein